MARIPTLGELVEDGYPLRQPFIPEGYVSFTDAVAMIWREVCGILPPQQEWPGRGLPSPAEREWPINQPRPTVVEFPESEGRDGGEKTETRHQFFGRDAFEWEAMPPQAPEYVTLYEWDQHIRSAVQNALYTGSLPAISYNDERREELRVPSGYWASDQAAIPCETVEFSTNGEGFRGRVWVPIKNVKALIQVLLQSPLRRQGEQQRIEPQRRQRGGQPGQGAIDDNKPLDRIAELIATTNCTANAAMESVATEMSVSDGTRDATLRRWRRKYANKRRNE